MKKHLFILLTMLFAFCASNKTTNENLLVGEVTESQLKKENWYQESYDGYMENTAIVAEIEPNITPEITIEILLGTWCHDSQREVPRFLKLLEALNFNKNNLTVITLDKEKGPKRFTYNKNIKRVPTFIFYKEGKEINRIVEYPVESLEKDMLKILLNHWYVPNYTE